MNRIPSWYFPIGHDSLGNLFIMSVYEENFGTIAFWDHEKESKDGNGDQYFDNVAYLADSFAKFMESLTK